MKVQSPVYHVNVSAAPRQLSSRVEGVMGGARVLVIDDDPATLRLAKLTLQGSGVEVITAPNGQEALRTIEDGAPDAVVLDLEMPVMDGRTFFHELRRRGHDTPVLILSAFDARRGCRELKADAFLAKPFEPEELVIMLAELIEAAEA